MNNNSSLSARIRRRNAQGFLGEGKHSFVYQPYGNYRDPEQNHKYDGRLNRIYDEEENKYKVVINPSVQQHLCTAAVRISNMRHPGSKPIRKLINAVKYNQK